MWGVRSFFGLLGTIVLGSFLIPDNFFSRVQQSRAVSGELCRMLWNEIVSRLGNDPSIFWIYGTVFLSFVIYWTVGGLYTYLDRTNPEQLRRYKTQPGKNEPVPMAAVSWTVVQVVFNQLFVGLIFAHLAYRIMEWRGFPPVEQLPSLKTFLGEILCSMLWEEIGFYYSHRLLHSPWLFRHIHKQHHDWTAPIAITALYCHPLEHVFSNLLPPFIGIFLLGSHLLSAWVWFALATLNTLNAHSGYHMPFLPSPEAHDFHHLKFNQCYGVFGVLDWIHDTNDVFRKSRSYERHRVLWSTRSAREAFDGDGKRDQQGTSSS